MIIRVNFGKVINNTTGGSAIIKYHSGNFKDSLNILMEFQDNNLYDSKYIYYCLLSKAILYNNNLKVHKLKSWYKKIVEIYVNIQNIEIQRNIVNELNWKY
ncbi:hypothetical protein HYE21_02855 [Mycoplasmopsis bovis]|nr:hypothetical protein [Mycoplasmopsis bovis]QQH24395.1 hypothetical protein HYE21_02855 [Mycoplasmopsis bovis]